MKYTSWRLFSCCTKKSSVIEQNEPNDLQECFSTENPLHDQKTSSRSTSPTDSEASSSTRSQSPQNIELTASQSGARISDKASSFASIAQSVERLVQYIMAGNEAKAEDMIKADSDLLYRKASGHNPANKQFNDIHPIEYAVWSRDLRMLKMILKYIDPQDAAAQIKNSQYKRIFSLAPFCTHLNTFVQKRGMLTESKKKTLFENINKAQQSFPAHIIQELGRPPCNLDGSKIRQDVHFSQRATSRTSECFAHMGDQFDQPIDLSTFYERLKANPQNFWVRGEYARSHKYRAMTFGYQSFDHYKDLPDFQKRMHAYQLENERLMTACLNEITANTSFKSCP